MHSIKYTIQNLATYIIIYVFVIIKISLLEYVQVSFKQSEYTVRESDGRVAITIQAARRYFYDSFYVKIRASVNRDLKPYGTYIAIDK